MAGSDIKSGHLHSSGFIFKGRARVRALDIVGSADEGTLEIWDTSVAPVAGTYGRSGSTVTVAKVGHGLSTGDVIGISFEPDAGVIATPGNYVITVTGADAFTLTDINSGTIANNPTCRYAATVVNGQPSYWLATYHTSATDIFFNGFQFPAEGILAKTGIYVFAENLKSLSVYYA